MQEHIGYQNPLQAFIGFGMRSKGYLGVHVSDDDAIYKTTVAPMIAAWNEFWHCVAVLTVEDAVLQQC